MSWTIGGSLLMLALALGPARVDAQGMVPGGGSKRTDCLVAVSGNGSVFPAGKTAKGLSCRDGDACDADGAANGRCRFTPSVCVNVGDPALPRCKARSVKRIKVKAGDATPALDAAVAALGLPSALPACTADVAVDVATGGPGRSGELTSGSLKMRLKGKAQGATDSDKVQLVCLPNMGSAGPTTTTLPGVPAGSGLVAAITGASVGAGGVVTATFTLTDAYGAPVTPVLAATENEGEARVRFVVSRIDLDTQAIEGTNTVTFSRYRSYVLNAAGQSTYDANGTLAVVDPAAGIHTYTFTTALPAGFDASLTHTIGAQVERTVAGQRFVANPVFDFVPSGAPVSVVRQAATTAECNACHGELAVHGGGRREVRLCQLCHTDQGGDPDTGNSIELDVLIHKIHRGKTLPSVQGAVGDKYSIIGFQGSELVFGERVRFCSGGANDSIPCETDADCGTGGTCVDAAGSTIKVKGVGFPQDIRRCEVCHAAGATAADYKTKPAAAPCQSCHDDINPGMVELGGVAPGTGHIPGAQPDGRCLLCHVPEGDEFSLAVNGAHTVPEQSAQLAGLRAEILSAAGAPGSPVTVQFRMTDGAGAPVDVTTGFNRVGFALSGPTTDFGGSSKPVITTTALGGGASGTLTPQGNGVFQYVTSAGNALPANASGTWRIGLEARRAVTVGAYCVGGTRNALPCEPDGCPDGECGYEVEETPQNAVLDFSVDGSDVEARRTVVDIANCQGCHGVFSQGFSIHGNLRNQTEYCVICHNPNVSDFARRVNSFCAVTCGANAVADSAAAGDDVQLVPQGNACSATACVVTVGADGVSDTTAAAGDGQRLASGVGAAAEATETIDLKPLIHRIHTGEELATQPFIVYGFGSAPLNFTAHDFGEVLYPNDRRRCESCHVDGSQLLPLPGDLLPTRLTAVDPATLTEVATGSVPPVQDACLSCHDNDAARAHAGTNTFDGLEACNVCHAEGRTVPVSEAHAGGGGE